MPLNRSGLGNKILSTGHRKITGPINFANNIAIKSTNSAGTADRDLIKLSTADKVSVGNNNNTLRFEAPAGGIIEANTRFFDFKQTSPALRHNETRQMIGFDGNRDAIRFGNFTDIIELLNNFVALNNVPIQSQESGGTVRGLIKLNASNQVEIGNINNPIEAKSNGIANLDGVPIAKQLSSFKTADESITNSTTLQDDDDLILALEANKTYFFVLDAAVEAGSTTPDIQFDIKGPTGSSGAYWGATSEAGTFDDVARTTLGAATAMQLDTGARPYILKGFIEMGGTAGNLRFRWSQNTSSADATTVRKGSFFMAWENL